ncbi:KTSC domain-containing protein [Sporosalibacterium faouarense]|uniref:KTSC domain-containing protein n=1 Tax=Sporosalibacterium faouarense TaxID=516123 RepID=UPI00141C62FF|nr:KTSC domain-containing protein [Sporosalibacterium faouarense]MTI47615.1 KTSC domain-containing protein [Bacillota bacterium]
MPYLILVNLNINQLIGGEKMVNEEIRYNDSNQILEIRMNNEHILQYQNVPYFVYQGLLMSDSKEHYKNNVLDSQYDKSEFHFK